MNKLLVPLLIITICFCATGQEIKSTGYRKAPALSIKGDFDGDGITDILRQFVSDSLGNELRHIVDGETWEDTVILYSKYKYYNAFIFNKKPAHIPAYVAVGLYCLINLGNINDIKGDEIAFVPDLSDFSRHNYCFIFTLCDGIWTECFEFSIHEGAFDYTGNTQPIFKNIPEALEFKDGQWKYYDYLEMPYETPEDVGKMLPLKVPDCK
ncbi:hypothetical protein GR160_07205 [Flavobacterium sp. Sd200]|uniref:hypothetical protein n=1 Tax=Flavobacterium sp. Sd200 TaxID=2692211 RepID=UPI00136B1E03|nr:hypothetical protein [Flavobacterium sp. Sd200]MXN91013.1 hypothetical protein [Flavobacterium sp. Sd200]